MNTRNLLRNKIATSNLSKRRKGFKKLKYFILDIFEITLSEKECEIYFAKHFLQMNLAKRKFYLENEKKYINFFYALFENSKKAVMKHSFSKRNVKGLLLYDKSKYAMLSQMLSHKWYDKICVNEANLELFVNFSFRQSHTVPLSFKIYFLDLGIYIYSLGDYGYLAICKDYNIKKLQNIAKRCGLFLRIELKRN